MGSHIFCWGARGADGGFEACSRVSPQSWYWGWRRTLVIHSPTIPCQTWDSNQQLSGYKSDSLSIRDSNPHQDRPRSQWHSRVCHSVVFTYMTILVMYVCTRHWFQWRRGRVNYTGSSTRPFIGMVMHFIHHSPQRHTTVIVSSAIGVIKKELIICSSFYTNRVPVRHLRKLPSKNQHPYGAVTLTFCFIDIRMWTREIGYINLYEECFTLWPIEDQRELLAE